jgi:hypothetical protein
MFHNEMSRIPALVNPPVARLAACALALLAVLSAAPARAQSGSGDVTAAARAYEEGLRAQLRREYGQAADLFELADRMAASAPALRTAIRNHEAAGHSARAVTLAQRAAERYPNDVDTKKLADGVIARLGPTLATLRVKCPPGCGLTLDGRVADDQEIAHQLQIEAGDHHLVASYADGRTVSRSLHATAGGSEELALPVPEPLAPAAAATTPASAPSPATVAANAPAPSAVDRPSHKLPPLVFAVGGVLTVASGALLAWSGVDTLSARDRYVRAPTAAGYHDGTGRELRTNILIGTTAGLAVASAAIAVFGTDWHHGLLGRSRPARAARLVPSAGVAPGVATVGLAGAF